MSKFISLILIAISAITLFLYFNSLIEPEDSNKKIETTEKIVVLKNEDTTEKISKKFDSINKVEVGLLEDKED